MSLAAKKRVLSVALAVLALWPLCHMLLVARCDVSAWKLGGWGMYAAPPLAPDVRIRVRRDGVWSWADLRDPPPWLRARLVDFQRRRGPLGCLARPDALAAAYLAAHPEADAVSVIVSLRRVNRNTALIEARETSYAYAARRGETAEVAGSRTSVAYGGACSWTRSVFRPCCGSRAAWPSTWPGRSGRTTSPMPWARAWARAPSPFVAR